MKVCSDSTSAILKINSVLKISCTIILYFPAVTGLDIYPDKKTLSTLCQEAWFAVLGSDSLCHTAETFCSSSCSAPNRNTAALNIYIQILLKQKNHLPWSNQFFFCVGVLHPGGEALHEVRAIAHQGQVQVLFYCLCFSHITAITIIFSTL